MATISFADNGSTVVRQEASNARMVALSIRPMRCNPAAVSWMAADKRLRYLVELAFFLIIARYLPQFHLRQRGCNLLVAVTQMTSVAKVDARIAAWKALCRGMRAGPDARPPLSLRRCRHATFSYIAGGPP